MANKCDECGGDINGKMIRPNDPFEYRFFCSEQCKKDNEERQEFLDSVDDRGE